MILFAVSITFKRRLGLYGKLFDSLIGMIGFGLVMFWIFTAIFSAGNVATHGPITVISQMRNELPGTPSALARRRAIRLVSAGRRTTSGATCSAGWSTARSRC